MGTQKGAKKSVKKSKKEVNKYDPDKVELTQQEEKLLKQNKQTLQKILSPLKQLQENIQANIQAIESAENKREFLRSLVNIKYGAPNNIYCNARNQQLDICICEYLCPSRCMKYSSNRFLCKSFGCSSEVREECEQKDYKCNSFTAFQFFPYRYVRAYAPLYYLRNTPDNVLDETPVIKTKKIKKKKKKKKKIAVT